MVSGRPWGLGQRTRGQGDEPWTVRSRALISKMPWVGMLRDLTEGAMQSLQAWLGPLLPTPSRPSSSAACLPSGLSRWPFNWGF